MDITDPSNMQDACHMNFVIDLAHRIRALNPKVWGSIPYGDSEFFVCPTLVTLYFFLSPKTYHLSYFYLHNPILFGIFLRLIHL